MIEQTIADAPALGARRIVVRTSSILLAFERIALMGLMYLLTALILVNDVTRYSHFPIYWIDESAVYCVVWLTFIGAYAMTRLRLDFAVTMMTERLSARNQKIAKVMATSGDIQPLGRKPPRTAYCGATRPPSSKAAPTTMKATMVATLIMASQNSDRP